MSSKFFKVIAVIISFGGIIMGVVLGFACEINTSDWYSSARYVFNTGLMFETWIVADLIALLFSWASAVLSKLERLEKKFCGNSEASSQSDLRSNIMGVVNSTVDKIKNYNAAAEFVNHFSNESPNPQTPQVNEWKSPKCGRINQNYTGTCGCGEPKPE